LSGSVFSGRPRAVTGDEELLPRRGLVTNDGLFDASWGDHEWVQAHARLVKIESGETIFQHRCTRCGRDFITVLSSGRRYAVGVSILSFHQLDDEVSQRWLRQQCPSTRLSDDDEDRKRRVAELAVFSIPRQSKTLQIQRQVKTLQR
jgi:hypothetical protein